MPRLHENTRVDPHDERAEIVIEPNQIVDLVQHWKSLRVQQKGTHDNQPRYKYDGDGSLLVMKIATSHPDVFVSFMCDRDWRSRVIGGPWVVGVGVEPALWHVPVGHLFSLTAHNRSRETMRTIVYMQLAAHARVGW